MGDADPSDPGGVLDFLGLFTPGLVEELLALPLASWDAFCCCLHFALRFLNQT